MKRFWLLIVAGVLWSTIAFAAPYFEFNPDFAQSLLVATAPGAVSQVFLPLNEFMAGFDLWVSNGSVAGPVTFTFYGPTDGVLATRTVVIPAIADSETGTRHSVSLPSQLSVNGSLAYRVGIATNEPTFRLYYSQQNQIIAHNGVPLPAYTGGLARIGSENQGYSFKFALTENNETSPPVISGVIVTQPAIGTVVVDFNANEPVDAQIQYNESLAAFSGQYSSCPSGVVPCSSTLSVTPGIPYSYTLTARDVWGNQSSATGQFTATGQPPAPTPVPPTPTPTGTTAATATPSATPDTTKPVITNARAAIVTTDSATVAWTTNEAANGIVAVFQLPFLTFTDGDSDSTLELEHAIQIFGLQENLLYHTIITTSDGSGNVASLSFDFLAAKATPVPPGATPTPVPTPSPVATPAPTVIISPSGGDGGSEVSWTPPSTGAPADGYRVDIIGADGKLIRSLRTNTTSVNVGSIPDGATVVVYGETDGLFEKVATPSTVRRTSLFERLVSALPYILGALVAAIAAVIAVVAWQNHKKASVQAGPPPPVIGAGPSLPGQ